MTTRKGDITPIHILRTHMFRQDHTRPQKIIKTTWCYTGPHNAIQGHINPQTAIQYHNVPQKITLCPIEPLWIHFDLHIFFLSQCTLFVTLHIFCSQFLFCSTPTTTKLRLGPLSIARGQKLSSSTSSSNNPYKVR